MTMIRNIIMIMMMMMMTTLETTMMQPSLFKLNGEAVMQLPRMIVLEVAIEAMTEVAMSNDIQPTSSEKVKSTNFQYVNRPFYRFLLSCLAFE